MSQETAARIALTIEPLTREAFAPFGDTGCTEPCMSGDSGCKIESCGSSCVAASCHDACGTRVDMA